MRAEIEDKLGNREGVLSTLRDVVKGYEALPPGQQAPKQLADAKKRLEDAERKPAAERK